MNTIKTANGWVGRTDVSGPLLDTLPAAFAYTYDSLAEAARIALMFRDENGLRIVNNGSEFTLDEVVEVLS